MNEKGAAQVRVVRKGKKGHGGHHGGAWKVAYADFVTAMMAFFLVMWLMNQNPSIRVAVQAYFQDPSGFMKAVNSGNSPLAKQGSGGNSLINIMPHTKAPNGKPTDAEMERERFRKTKESVEKMMKRNPDFKALSNSVQIRITQEGLRISLFETSGDVFFDAGSASPKPKTCQLLGKIAAELSKLPNKVIVEGHTDSRPYRGPNGWTNWELSAARANAARSLMQSRGLRNSQMIEVRGLADRMPSDPKHPESFVNRRVSILLPFQHSAKSKALP